MARHLKGSYAQFCWAEDIRRRILEGLKKIEGSTLAKEIIQAAEAEEYAKNFIEARWMLQNGKLISFETLEQQIVAAVRKVAEGGEMPPDAGFVRGLIEKKAFEMKCDNANVPWGDHSSMELLDYQEDRLARLSGRSRVALYHDMGLGKTHEGSEIAYRMGGDVLLICQKSKIGDWKKHYEIYYGDTYEILILTSKKDFECFLQSGFGTEHEGKRLVAIINYDLVWRREELLSFSGYILMLDESSEIANERSNRGKFVLKLNPAKVILLSGTPVSGKYERLWSQCRLLGWSITKTEFYDKYIRYEERTFRGASYATKIVTGYKNVEDLKEQLRLHGADFLQTSEVLDMPEQRDIQISVPVSSDYKKFSKNRYLLLKDGSEMIGENPLTARLRMRQLCGGMSKEKLSALADILESTSQRLVIFYQFNEDLKALEEICKAAGRPISYINGQQGKQIENFEAHEDAICLCQYQAAAKGHNLQKASTLIFFDPTDKCEDYMQSRKRIHRIGQKNVCTYYHLICEGSIEEDIRAAVSRGEDYTLDLFREKYMAGEDAKKAS